MRRLKTIKKPNTFLLDSLRTTLACILATSLSVVGLLSCDAPKPAEAVRPVIGVSLLTKNNLFFVEMSMAMMKQGYDDGYSVKVEYGEFDSAKQAAQIERFIKDGVEAIVLCPVDSKKIAPIVKKANEAKIPVFTADIGVLSGDAKVVAHVATDNYRGGRLAAEAISEALGGAGKVAILDHPEVESVIQRTKGFTERMAELNDTGAGNIEIVERLPAAGKRDVAFKKTLELLKKHPDLNGIFAINDPSALGVVEALERERKIFAIKVVGFDGQPEALEALIAGKIHADVVQLPKQIGRETLKAVDSHMRDQPVAPETLIPPTLVKTPDP